MKVIVAGYPKTGTKSMAAALTRLGFSVYDALENVVYLQDEYIKIVEEGWTTEDFRRMYETVDAVCDMPACFFWDEIHKAFPDAKIVLTLRDDEDVWWKSLVNQMKASDKFLPRMMEILSPTAGRSANRIVNPMTRVMFGGPYRNPWSLKPATLNDQLAKKCYRSHNAYVMATAPKDKLLVYKCSQGWDPLCKFLGVPVPSEPFPRKNVRGNIVNELQDNTIFKQLQKEMTTSVIKLTVVAGLVTYCAVKYGPVQIAETIYDQAKSALHKLPFW